MAKDKIINSFFTKLMQKYRLVIINDDTFEQKTSIKLTKFNLYIGAGSLMLFLIILITSTIAYTNLKYYLPGVGKLDFRQKISTLSYETDSLNAELSKRNLWISNFQKVLSGEIENVSLIRNDTSAAVVNVDSIDLEYIPDESKLLREEVESLAEMESIDKLVDNASIIKEEDVYNGLEIKLDLISPVKGLIIKSFSFKDTHFGIDIAGKEGENIKAIYNGTVILSEWNPKTGHVIAIQHPGNLISFYKHNSLLLKKRGTFVNKGEAIAIIGNTGELSTGPHLHFEIWKNGQVQNPSKFINIEKLN